MVHDNVVMMNVTKTEFGTRQPMCLPPQTPADCPGQQAQVADPKSLQSWDASSVSTNPPTCASGKAWIYPEKPWGAPPEYGPAHEKGVSAWNSSLTDVQENEMMWLHKPSLL